MADAKPQNQEISANSAPASSAPQDYDSVLSKVIEDISKDHALLRKLVYALAWHNLKPEAVLARPTIQAPQEAKSIVELERALELERAIERIESRSWAKTFEPASKHHSAAAETPPQEQPPPSSHEAPAAFAPIINELTDPPGGKGDSIKPIESPQILEPPQMLEPLPNNTAIAKIPDPPRARPERSEGNLQRIPAWLDPNIRVSLDSVDYAPIRQAGPGQAKFTSFFQLVAASILGVLLYIGISGWVHMSRQAVTGSAPSGPQIAAPKVAETSNGTSGPTVDTQVSTPPPPEPQPLFPFPLPRNYGVYAAAEGRLVALEQLPIKVPIPRVQVSAEITQPSNATVAGNILAFVVYRRDLTDSAPQSVSVRVVARVRRTMKFVNNKATFEPLEGVWRIRDKAFEFQVTPIETNREMIVIQPQPEFVFPPGRYALVLNGYGYDFTVAGDVRSPEQCLEQTQVQDGIIVTECPKS